MPKRDGSTTAIADDPQSWPRGRTGPPRTDEEIEAAVRDDPDAAPLDIDWSEARVVNNPPGAELLTVLIDRDVVAWFRAQGPGLSQRVNDVLRAYYEEHRAG